MLKNMESGKIEDGWEDSVFESTKHSLLETCDKMSGVDNIRTMLDQIHFPSECIDAKENCGHQKLS